MTKTLKNALLTTIGGLCLLTSLPSAANTTITFMHLNDLHANLVPHTDLELDPNSTTGTRYVERGGLARTATLIKSIRANNPNSLLMNVGDTFHGGVEALFSNGDAIVDPVNALGIDVGVAGNWDFAFGPKITRARYGKHSFFSSTKRPNFPNLAANVTYTFPFFKKGKTFMPATMVTTIDDVSIGFIGITSDIVPEMAEFLATGLNFLQGEQAYVALINKHTKALRDQGVDIVVVMSELGLQKDVQLANKINADSVDVFFSAHTHETTEEPIQSDSGAVVVESGNDGYLGQMDIDVVDHTIVNKRWTLHRIDNTLAEDEAMKALVATARAPFLDASVDMTAGLMQGNQTLRLPINTVIGHTHAPLTRRHSLESDFNNALTDMLREITGTDIAMTKGFRFESVIPEKDAVTELDHISTGAITIEDVYRFFPTAFRFSTATTSAENLKRIIEKGLTQTYSKDAFKQQGGWFEGFSGLSLILDLAAEDGNRIKDIQLQNTTETLEDSTQLSITGCTRPIEATGVLCDFSGFNDVTPVINPETGSTWSNIDLFIKAIQEQRLPTQNRRDIEDISQTPLWPFGPFIQPVNGTE